ncbi:MAG: site-specific recombinase [Rhodocyclaceae bacterium]
MERLLARFAALEANPKCDLGALLTQLIDEIRPYRANDFESARRSLQALCHILNTQPELRAGLRQALLTLNQSYRHSELYTATGILPNTGFVAETFRRIGHTLLPDVLDPDLLRTVLRKAFHKPGDRHWVIGIGEAAWQQLIEALRFDEVLVTPDAPALPHAIAEILRSLRVISYWIAAFGMEPELLRLEPSLETYESPFVTQNHELIAYIDAYPASWRQPAAQNIDEKHLRVLHDQCREVIERVRKHAARDGTSIRLTYHLQRLQQLLRRSEQLLDLLADLQDDPDGPTAYPAIVRLFSHLVRDECQRNNLQQHWRQNVELIALRVTDNAGQHGDHYITETREEYWSMARSAMIGGVIIACMACLKILLGKAEMPPLTGAIAFCLNYGLGFCLIHILHGTVATKQPAMTANAIAASIGEAGGKLRNIENLTCLMARTVRSQLIAILGNICIAIPLAGLIAFAIFSIGGEHFVSPEKAAHLFVDQSPIDSGALFYAAIAGVCLFLAGLISGYYDNYAAYNRIPERILQLGWPKRLFGERRMRRVSSYIGDNLGSLAGNLFFGFLLGGVTIFGVLFGLPLDIRHVAFASAFLGIAFVGLDFAPDVGLFAWAALGVAAIGLINLAVSFTLALNVALRARQIPEAPWRLIAGSLLNHLLHQPRDFFLPPKKG